MYLTIVRTPHDPEDEDSGFLRVDHVPVPRPELVKGGAARNKQITRATYAKFVEKALVVDRTIAASHEEAIVDWLMVAGPGDNMLLPPFGGCDGAVLVLHAHGEPTCFGVRRVAEPKFVLTNYDDDEAEPEDEDDDEDEEDEEEPRKPANRDPKLKPKKKPR